MAKLTTAARKAPPSSAKIDAKADKMIGKNADRAADRTVARMNKPKPVR